MTREQAKSLLANGFNLDAKLAGRILDFLEKEVGMHPPTHKTRSWVTHYIEEWEVSEIGSRPAEKK